MGRFGLTAITFFVLFGLSSTALGQRTARSSLWREWSTIENQWQIEKRALAADRKRFAARAEAPPEKTRKKPKKKAK